MALFGGNKGKLARKDNGEAREAELLAAIETVQGRGRWVRRKGSRVRDLQITAVHV